jgi:hypothetical protein
MDKHVIIDVFKIFSIGWKDQKQANKQIAKVVFQGIVLLRVYINPK